MPNTDKASISRSSTSEQEMDESSGPVNWPVVGYITIALILLTF